MNLELKHLIGVLYLLYGILKIAIGVCVMSLPRETTLKLPIVKIFAKKDDDHTVSGILYELVLTAFGVFTLVNGLAILDVLPHHTAVYFENKYTEYIVFIVLGTILTVFYSLVLFTSLPIPKKKESYNEYKLYGIGGGLSFLIMPVLWEVTSYLLPAFHRLSMEEKSICVIGFTIILTIIAGIIYKYMKRRKIKARDVIPRQYVEGAQTIKSGVNIIKSKSESYIYKSD
jgi:hypothetical protein